MLFNCCLHYRLIATVCTTMFTALNHPLIIIIMGITIIIQPSAGLMHQIPLGHVHVHNYICGGACFHLSACRYICIYYTTYIVVSASHHGTIPTCFLSDLWVDRITRSSPVSCFCATMNSITITPSNSVSCHVSLLGH